jgi:hypothetical protein
MSGARMIAVENVNVPGRVSRVNAERYLAMREVLLSVLPAAPPGLTQTEMIDAVVAGAPQTLWPNGDKAGWWMKTVQLDLEAKGLVVRERSAKPTRWYRS